MPHRLARIETGPQNPLFSMYPTLKFAHIGFALISISGFVLRGVWMMRGSSMLDMRFVRVAPHVVDTLFLITGVWLVLTLDLNVLRENWLFAKLVALSAYVVLGALALRRGKTIQIRISTFVAALATFLYIWGVALYKTPASWLGM